MAKVKLYNAEGKDLGEKELNDALFGVKVNPSTVHEVVVGMQANARNTVAHTKTRGEVRGGGKKPWKQKGTGRARHGSSRSPIWSGGGITFGPRSDRNYSKKINKKTKRAAFAMTLTDKLNNNKLFLVDELKNEDGKTKVLAGMLEKLPVNGKVAIVTPESNATAVRSARNLQNVYVASASNVSLMDVLYVDHVIMTPEAADKLTASYVTA